MSKIKQIRKSDENNINLIRLIEQLISTDKTKYIELFRKALNNKWENVNTKKRIYEELYITFPNKVFSDDLTTIELIYLSTLVGWINTETINLFDQFIDYNERKLIEKNDLTTYKTFDEISCEISKVDLKLITKEMESQVFSLYSDDEWLVIKPLTYESSKKYGSNTKWCTTSAQNPEYFFRYTKNGILIYCINRKTGYKVAAYKDMKEKEISFWNQKDERIDSFYTELPDSIISILRNEFKTCNKSNGSIIDANTRAKEMMKYYTVKEKMTTEVMADSSRRIRIDNRYDEAENRPEIDGGENRPERPERPETPMTEDEILEQMERRYDRDRIGARDINEDYEVAGSAEGA